MSVQKLVPTGCLGLFCGVVLCLLGPGPGCRSDQAVPPPGGTTMQPQTSAASRQGDASAELREIVRIGCLRSFGPDGPREVLPTRYYAYVRDHPTEALQILEPDIASGDEIRRCNAYDFLAELLKVRATHDRAAALMRRGLADPGFYTATFVRERMAETADAP